MLLIALLVLARRAARIPVLLPIESPWGGTRARLHGTVAAGPRESCPCCIASPRRPRRGTRPTEARCVPFRVMAHPCREPVYPESLERAFARATCSDRSAATAYVRFDAHENYPAWLAHSSVPAFDPVRSSYSVRRPTSAAIWLRARRESRAGGAVLSFATSSRAHLRTGRTILRKRVRSFAFHPPLLLQPARLDRTYHLKTSTGDGESGFVSGLCVSGEMGCGTSGAGMEPGATTGIELRGPAVAELTACRSPKLWHGRVCDTFSRPLQTQISDVHEGNRRRVRVPPWSQARANATGTTVSILSAIRSQSAAPALASTDAYFVGTGGYVQALAAAARGPRRYVRLARSLGGAKATSDTDAALSSPPLKLFARFRFGVASSEWNGTNVHAKPEVADGFVVRAWADESQCSRSWNGDYGAPTSRSRTVARPHNWPPIRNPTRRPRPVESCSRFTPPMSLAQEPGRDRWLAARSGQRGRVAAGAVSGLKRTRCALHHRRNTSTCRISLLNGSVSWLSESLLLASLWPPIDRVASVRAGELVASRGFSQGDRRSKTPQAR